MVKSGHLSAPSADWKRRRFSRTFSRASQLVKPKFKVFSPSTRLTPPARMLKPWTSQGILFNAADWRIRTPLKLRLIIHLPDDAARMGGGEPERGTRGRGRCGDFFTGTLGNV